MSLGQTKYANHLPDTFSFSNQPNSYAGQHQYQYHNHNHQKPPPPPQLLHHHRQQSNHQQQHHFVRHNAQQQQQQEQKSHQQQLSNKNFSGSGGWNSTSRKTIANNNIDMPNLQGLGINSGGGGCGGNNGNSGSVGGQNQQSSLNVSTTGGSNGGLPNQSNPLGKYFKKRKWNKY